MKTYGDFTRTEIEAIIDDPEFERQMAEAKARMEAEILKCHLRLMILVQEATGGRLGPK